VLYEAGLRVFEITLRYASAQARSCIPIVRDNGTCAGWICRQTERETRKTCAAFLCRYSSKWFDGLE
tara:strand:- start:19722 stop:19922 length:201 start_codon:yes stop_codon:yes gene_type:complete